MFRVLNKFLKSYNSIRHYPSCDSRRLYSGNNFRSDLPQSEIDKMFKSPMFNMMEASKQQIQEFLDSFDTVLADCDGVLWIGDSAITGAAEVLNYFRKIGKKIFYVTNNSTKNRAEFAFKAQQLGFDAKKEEILSSAYLVAQYLKGIGFIQKVYVIGSNGIGDELTAVGIKHTGIGPDPFTPGFACHFEVDPSVAAVVVGFDEHFSYPKLLKAATYLENSQCIFVGTNSDERFPRSLGHVVPGTGALLRAVETCAQLKANVIGKPNDYIRNYLVQYGFKPARTLMIGDRINTDIEFGVRCGFRTMLVMTGVTTDKDLEKMKKDKKPPLPDVIIPSLGTLKNVLPKK